MIIGLLLTTILFKATTYYINIKNQVTSINKNTDTNTSVQNFADRILKDRKILLKLAAAVKLQDRLGTSWQRRQASTIAKFEKAPSLTRLYELMNTYAGP
jgi:uncharacterized membrane protein